MTQPFAVRRFPDPTSFYERARPFLLASESEYNLVLGLTRGMIERGEAPADALFATVEDAAGVRGCVFRTPPEKLVLTRMPLAAVPAVEAEVAAHYDALPAVLANESEGAAFAALWAARHGLLPVPGMRQGIYELTRVVEPRPLAPGFLRRAETGDVPLVGRWLAGFAEESAHPIADPEQAARIRIERGVFWLWQDGEPVCMAGRMARTENGDRIGLVYTPPECRGRGYASACVARLSRQVLDEGLRFCSLYTDMANATSNAIYQRLGYTLVAETMDHGFAAPS